MAVINAPSENDCDQLIPVQRLINIPPPSLPAMAIIRDKDTWVS